MFGHAPARCVVPRSGRAAVAGGFSGLSLWGRDYRSLRREGPTDTAMRGLLADALHARSLNAIDVFGGTWSVDDAATAFAGLCDRATEHGLLVHIESLPWSRIPNVSAAWEIVCRADRPNGGVLVDARHFFRSQGDFEALRTVPGDRVLALQLDGGPSTPEPDLPTASLHERALPGAGELDLAGLLATLREIDAVAPVGVKVFSDGLHALRPAEIGRRAGAAVCAVLENY